MIRHKHESSDTGDGASITVSTPSGFSNDVSTVRPASIGGYSGANRIYSYVLIDANGTGWEHGYGRVATTTFYRDYVIESTNSNSRIVLSSGTHTVLVEDQPLTGLIAPLEINASTLTVTTGSTGSFTWSSLGTSNDGATEWTGYSAPTLSVTAVDLDGVIPYARSLSVTLLLSSDGTVSDNADVALKGDGGYYDTIMTHTMRTDADDVIHAVVKSPELEVRCPFNDSTNDGYYLGDYKVSVTNRGSASCDFECTMVVDYKI